LDKILGGFDKIHQELQDFIDHHDLAHDEEKEEIERLNNELETHKKESQRAMKVAEKIKEFTSF